MRSASIAAGYIPRAQVPENNAVVKATREARGSSSGIDPLACWDLEKTDSESETEMTLAQRLQEERKRKSESGTDKKGKGIRIDFLCQEGRALRAFVDLYDRPRPFAAWGNRVTKVAIE